MRRLSMHCESALGLGLDGCIWLWLRCRDGACIALFGGAVMAPIYQGAPSVLHAWLSMHCESALRLGLDGCIWLWLRCRDGACIVLFGGAVMALIYQGAPSVLHAWLSMHCESALRLGLDGCIWLWLRCRDGACIVLFGGAVMALIYQGAPSVLHAWLSMHCESALRLGLDGCIWLWLRCRDGACIVLFGGAVMAPIYQGAPSVPHAWLSMHCESALRLGLDGCIWLWLRCLDGSCIVLLGGAVMAPIYQGAPSVLHAWLSMHCESALGLGLDGCIWLWLRCRDGACIVLFGGAVMALIYQGAPSVLHASVVNALWECT